MDETGSVIQEIASTYFVYHKITKVKELFNALIELDSTFKNTLLDFKTSKDIEAIFNEATRILRIHAGVGRVSVNNPVVVTIRSTVFDTIHGFVTIDGSKISMPIVIKNEPTETSHSQRIALEKTKSSIVLT